MSFRILLYPFSLIFLLILRVRHFLFDKGILASRTFDLPVICVGNLSTGGTGKTPHTEYLIRFLSRNYNVAVLSRGYGRRTSGFRWVLPHDVCKDVGDEPLQYKRKFGNIAVAVDEKRARGIDKILEEDPTVEVLVLDDAFQHRYVNVGMNILLSTYQSPFFRDSLLPMGNLRDIRSAASRADVLIFTKTPSDIQEHEMKRLASSAAKYTSCPCFFSEISYDDLVLLEDTNVLKPPEFLSGMHVVFISGIADPRPLLNRLKNRHCTISELRFRDHHNFSLKDIKRLQEKFNNIEHPRKLILTTEKDAMRLGDPEIMKELAGLPVYFQRITTVVRDGDKFCKLIYDYVEGAKANSSIHSGNIR